MRHKRWAVLVATVVVLTLAFAGVSSAATDTYSNQTLTAGTSGWEVDSGHFDGVYDLTAGDITLSFTYDGNGLVDDFGGAAAHAWAELGVRSATDPYTDFSPNYTFHLYSGTANADLFADQNIDVGGVTVVFDGDHLDVTYHLVAGWCMTQSHFAVAMDPDDIPQAKGNPIPGQFPYGESYGSCMTGDVALPPIPLSDIAGYAGLSLYFAAHAVVWDMSSATTMSLVSAPGVGIVGGGSAVAAKEPFNYAVCAAYTASDAAMSVWDNGIGAAFTYFNTNPKADWIWSTPDPLHPVAGDVVTFEKAFNVPGLPTGGSLRITADNGYAATLNGASVGTAQLGPGFPGTLRELVLGQPLPKMGAWGVSSQGWQTVETWPLAGLTMGSNVLQVVAANEYMWDDDKYYSTPPYTSGPVAIDPRPNVTGINDCYNPGGLIFKADVSYYARSETAWAGTDDFPGRNWATYFSFIPTSVTVVGSGVWLATDYDWTVNTFAPDVVPNLDLDDKLILQRVGGHAEADYNLPSVPPAPGNNHRVWWDRDGVDPWQNPATANTGGIYQVVITLHATDAWHGTAYMNIRGLNQGFETDGVWSTIELTPAGMTWTGDLKHLQVFYGLGGYGATHSVTFSDITVTQ